jgi:hypothetical protein
MDMDTTTIRPGDLVRSLMMAVNGRELGDTLLMVL